jgi:hypothetical protein
VAALRRASRCEISRRARRQSNAGPGSVLRPGAMSLWAARCSMLSDGYALHSERSSNASDWYCGSA